jgi:hypothetical protein
MAVEWLCQFGESNHMVFVTRATRSRRRHADTASTGVKTPPRHRVAARGASTDGSPSVNWPDELTCVEKSNWKFRTTGAQRFSEIQAISGRLRRPGDESTAAAGLLIR